MMIDASRGRSSSYLGNDAGGLLGFFGSSSPSSERRLLHPVSARRHDDDVSASASAAAADHLADLDEEDVWSAVNNSHRPTHRGSSGPASNGLSPHSAPVSVPECPAATLPPDDGDVGGSDLDDDDDLEWVPPHEYLQRRWSGAGGSSSSSVLEGAGRTLKGRDITRVRDAVWSKTGFLG